MGPKSVRRAAKVGFPPGMLISLAHFGLGAAIGKKTRQSDFNANVDASINAEKTKNCREVRKIINPAILLPHWIYFIPFIAKYTPIVVHVTAPRTMNNVCI